MSTRARLKQLEKLAAKLPPPPPQIDTAGLPRLTLDDLRTLVDAGKQVPEGTADHFACLDFVPPADRERFRAVLAAALKVGEYAAKHRPRFVVADMGALFDALLPPDRAAVS